MTPLDCWAAGCYTQKSRRRAGESDTRRRCEKKSVGRTRTCDKITVTRPMDIPWHSSYRLSRNCYNFAAHFVCCRLAASQNKYRLTTCVTTGIPVLFWVSHQALLCPPPAFLGQRFLRTSHCNHIRTCFRSRYRSYRHRDFLLNPVQTLKRSSPLYSSVLLDESPIPAPTVVDY